MNLKPRLHQFYIFIKGLYIMQFIIKVKIGLAVFGKYLLALVLDLSRKQNHGA